MTTSTIPIRQPPLGTAFGKAKPTTARMRLGAFGEAVARSHLGRLGYRILQSNVRLKAGEIDLIAKDGEALVFLEVRTRKGRAFGTPEESITPRKAHRMARLAYAYLRTMRAQPPDWRIDVVAVEVAPDGRVSRVEVIKGAVGEQSAR